MTLRGSAYTHAKRLLPAPARTALELFAAPGSVLNATGWRQSRKLGAPIDGSGHPLPWFTYAAIRFLADRLKPDFRVFEFGSGHSTLWWAERVSSVVSAEHHEGWHRRVSKGLPANATLLLRNAENYCGSAVGSFDIIVIDGIMRPQCARQSLASLKSDGVIVWDNTDEVTRAKGDEEGYAFLEREGFKRLDFWGLGPILAVEWCTSVFYRENNCLGI